MDLSIITVSYFDKSALDVTLEAIFKSTTKYSYEVIVVNNASPDGSMDMVRQKYYSNPNYQPKLKLIDNKTNLGFGKGNNIGMKVAKGDYILLLNSDTKVDEDNFEVMLDFIKTRPDIGIVTCKLLKPDGTLDAASRRSEPDPKISFYRLSGLQRLFPNKFGSYNLLNSDINQESQLDACVGAYMLMSRKAYEVTQGFDEDFFMYGEDLDLCKRVRDAGLKIWYYPNSSCIHFKGQSSKRTPQKMIYYFHFTMWLYYKKHYQSKYNILMDFFVYVGIWGRFIVKSILNLLRPKHKRFVSK